jgi:hypothetical protein
MTATAPVQPPGQLHLVPPALDRSASSYRVVFVPDAGTPRETAPVRDLPVAAGRAHHAACQHGEAWIVAADGSSAHVDAAGTVTPLSGWATKAARVINNRKAPSP